MSSNKIAFLFPGQGSQAVGMGYELTKNFAVAQGVLEAAEGLLRFPLGKIMELGPEEELKKTDITQPALFTVSVMAAAVLQECGIAPDGVAGHSVGEYAAAHTAGILSFDDGLTLVRKRGEIMQEAAEKTPGSMAAVMGLDDDKVEEICASIKGVVVPANYNTPGQLVISGEKTAIALAVEKLKEAGAKRAMELAVSGGFHSPLMQEAQDLMRAELAKAEWNAPQCVFVPNVTAVPESNPAAIKTNLEKQITGSVKWTQSIQKMIADGFDTFIEVGSGKVLTGLLRRIDKSVTGLNVENAESLEKTLEALRG